MNYFAILAAALVPMLLGFIWYHPKLFGTIWMQQTGMTEEKAKQGNMAVKLGLSFLFSVMIAFVLNGLAVHDTFVQGALYYETNRTMKPQPGSESAQWLDYYNTRLAASNHTFPHGAFHGLFLTGLLIALPLIATNALFEGRGFKYIAVNAGYWLVCLSLMGGIIAAWR